jgi:branched-chain amino acid aminotransferase
MNSAAIAASGPAHSRFLAILVEIEGVFAMPLQTTKNIWHNGKLIPWESANIHVMSHVVHYGSSIFEGIRAYTQEAQGTAGIFRLEEHMQRFRDSGHIYRMPLGYTVAELSQAVVDVVEANGIAPCYIRPVAFRGYGEAGVNPLRNPVEVYIINFPWGKYVPGNQGANVCVSSWNRNAPNTTPTMAKAGGNYLNSQLIRMEAEVNGYDEGIALDVNGTLSEGSGENLFLVRGGVLYTTPLTSAVLNGITRTSIITIAKDLGIPVIEQALAREFLYVCEEAFFTGTAAEVTHLRSVDRILIGDGTIGPITKAIHDEFFGIVQGSRPDRYGWLTPVNVKVEEPVGA